MGLSDNKQPGTDLARRRFGSAAVLGAVAVFALAAAGLSIIAPNLGPFSAPPSKAAVEVPLKIVATTSMLADAARAIGGERVEVRALMGPGVDPHAYRQTRTDIARLVKSDLAIWNGLYLEAQMEDFFKDLAKHKTVFAAAEIVDRAKLLGHEDYDGRLDPHVWMDPDLWTQAVAGVRDQLIALDPAGEEIYRRNGQRYLEQISAVAKYARTVLETVPAGNRVLLTAHDAFRYFGRAYGFEVIGIQGISTESEAGLNRIKVLVDMLVERKISAIFIESSVADRNIRALIEGAASRGHKVVVGGELFSDAMGLPGTYEGTYIGMIDHNATVITRSLGGATKKRGMSGKLAVTG
ncbi:MAG: zinc ABC transporter substrate-binding protein [Alphaproteobacteria bacterium]|nr:zinc ABC transporter substrate-binding protein [Alphaproteobacteria bacterium]